MITGIHINDAQKQFHKWPPYATVWGMLLTGTERWHLRQWATGGAMHIVYCIQDYGANNFIQARDNNYLSLDYTCEFRKSMIFYFYGNFNFCEEEWKKYAYIA